MAKAAEKAAQRAEIKEAARKAADDVKRRHREAAAAKKPSKVKHFPVSCAI